MGKDKLVNRILAAVYIAALILLFSTGMNWLRLSDKGTENSRLIGASYMTMNNEFYDILNEQIRVRVEGEGDLMMGVKIIVVDTEVEQEGLADCTIVSDNYRAGYAIGEYMMKKQESGRILVLEHETAISGRRRVQGFKDSIAGNKRFEIVNEIGCKGQYEIALPLVEDYIQDGGEFDTVFCLNDLAGEAAVTAVRRHPELGKVYVYGVDGSPDAKSMIGAGEMEATAAQFPTEIGEEAADTLYKMLRGEEYESTITVPIDLVYYSNLEQYDSNRWQ